MYSKRLKELRTLELISQSKLCKEIGIESNTYAEYETEYKIIPIKHLNSLCNYFNVSFDYIFEFTNEMNYKNEKNEINKDISGKRLKELRKQNKITQDKLASILNVSRTTIAEYERGTNIIATPFLYTICKTYGVSADYILGKIDYIPKL